MSSHQVANTPIHALTPFEHNARTHSRKQIQQIARSIEQFGFNNPVLVDNDYRIIAGHGRVQAAQLLGMQAVPTICLDHLSEAETRAYILADNRLADLAGWDQEILAIEFQHLMAMDIDFDIEITGFDLPEIEIMIDPPGDEDREPPIPDLPGENAVVSQVGDLWALGDHRVICSDARNPETYSALLGNERARLQFTDPPYNVPIDGHVSGLGEVRHEDFVMACGEMTEVEFTAFLITVLSLGARYSVDGALHYICMDWRHLLELLNAGHSVFDEHLNLCVWNKTNGGMGSLYRSKHEMVLVFKHGTAAHINNVQLGKYGRYRTNVWDYAGMSSTAADRADNLAMHPTVKPVALVADVLRDASHRGDIVLDAFGGAGSTLLAAELTGRKARLIEIDPRYVDVTIQRWQQETDGNAVLLSTGQTFSEISEARLAGDDASTSVDIEEDPHVG
ncbi:site-specific DNA-methyltransferase [Candidatus Marimicrobium litorale]|uniref:Methyltransferase n=1 Tax=Candidatus Marimicrobium litorale TaxID=2518991 RepID=A0ABT3T4I1_9GAMM|nr:site-specific DNA-methyltransferase [Candidatus Marimicrobium litorale]MCX2977169.1 DNA methylase N-4 [Candidatus Marimicrobium litorale]